MFELFKNYLKNSFKEKMIFITILILIFLASLVSISGFSLIQTLSKYNINIINNQTNYDYYFDYTSRNNDASAIKKTFSPWTFFSSKYNDVISSSSTEYSLPYFSIGSDGDGIFNVDKNSTSINFNDIFLNINNKSDDSLNTSIANLNLSNNSLILFLKMYQETIAYKNIITYFLNFNKYWKNQGLSDIDVTKKSIELNFSNDEQRKWNFDLTNDNLSKIDNSQKVIHKNADDSNPEVINLNNIYEKGLGGRVGQFGILQEESYASDISTKYLLIYLIGDSYTEFSDLSTNLQGIGGYSIENLYNKTWFVSTSNYYNLDLFNMYVNLVGQATNFNTLYYNALQFYDSSRDLKIKFIDATNQNENFENTNNAIKLNMESKLNHYDPYSIYTNENMITINQTYAHKNNVKLNNSISIKTELNLMIKLQVCGIGNNYNDSYPLIYDNDIINNSSNELNAYVSKRFFENKTNISENLVNDESKIYLNHFGNNSKTYDLNKFKSYLFDDIFNIKTFLNKNDSTLTYSVVANNGINNYLSKNMLSIFIKYLKVIFITAFIMFTIISLVSIRVLIKRKIKTDEDKIGILKALGVNKISISSAYSSLLLIPICFGILISYPLGILTQYIIIGKIGLFINLTTNLNAFIWEFILIAIFIIFTMISFTIYVTNKQISKNTVLMLSKIEIDSKKKYVWKENPLKKFNIVQLGLKTSKTSLKRMLIFSGAMFVSTTVLVLVVSAPFQIWNIKKNYYKNLNYNNSSFYTQLAINNPFLKYLFYDNSNKPSLIPEYYKIPNDNTNTIYKTIDMNLNDNAPNNLTYETELKNLFGFKFISMLSNSFSQAQLENAINMKFDNNPGQDSGIASMTQIIINKLLPELLQSDETINPTDDWKETLSTLISKKMPSALMKDWSNEKIRKNFSIDFNQTSFNKNEDQLIVHVDANYNNQKYNLIGLNDEQKQINVTTSNLSFKNNALDVLVSQKLLNQANLKVGQTFVTDITKRVQEYKTNNNIYVPIDSSWWKYNDNGSYIKLNDGDLQHLTYENYLQGNGALIPEYINDNGEYEEYKSLSNIELWLPYNNGNANDVNSKMIPWGISKNNANIFNEKKDNGINYLTIKAFNWNYSKSEPIQSIYDLISSGTLPDIWFTDAEKNNLISLKSVSNNINLKIKNCIGIYDRNTIYTNKKLLNQIYLGEDSNWIDSYFNGKISNNINQNDSLRRFGISVITGNADISKNQDKDVRNMTNSYEFLATKMKIFDQIFMICLLFSAIFMIIVIIASLVSISMLSNLFIDYHNKLILLMNTMGFNKKEIYSTLLIVLVPFIFTSIFLGSFLPETIIYLIIKIISKSDFIIPLSYQFYIPIAFVMFMIILFLIVFIKTYNSLLKKSIQERILI